MTAVEAFASPSTSTYCSSADPAAIGKATAIRVTDSGRSLLSLHLLGRRHFM